MFFVNASATLSIREGLIISELFLNNSTRAYELVPGVLNSYIFSELVLIITMSVWVKSRSGNEEAFKVNFNGVMDFADLKKAITHERDFASSSCWSYSFNSF